MGKRSVMDGSKGKDFNFNIIDSYYKRVEQITLIVQVSYILVLG